MKILGEKGRGLTLYKKLYYKGCHFHRVVKDFMIQSGDFTEGNFLLAHRMINGHFKIKRQKKEESGY